MDTYHLRTHEVNYELKIRSVTTSSAEMPEKRKYLRRELQKDLARAVGHVYRTPNFVYEVEQREIEESIKSLTPIVDDFDGSNKEVYKRLRSRINHIKGRVQRIPETISDEISGYRGDNLILISSFEDDVEDIMGKHKQGETDRNSAATPTTNEAPSTFKSFPVYKFGLTFNGTTELPVDSFLEQVEELSFSRIVSKDELFRSAIELFDGPAKLWFRRIKNKLNSWDDLVVALRRDFLPDDYDDDLWETIRARKQQVNERAIIFTSVMENLFDRLVVKAPDREKLTPTCLSTII